MVYHSITSAQWESETASVLLQVLCRRKLYIYIHISFVHLDCTKKMQPKTIGSLQISYKWTRQQLIETENKRKPSCTKINGREHSGWPRPSTTGTRGYHKRSARGRWYMLMSVHTHCNGPIYHSGRSRTRADQSSLQIWVWNRTGLSCDIWRKRKMNKNIFCA